MATPHPGVEENPTHEGNPETATHSGPEVGDEPPVEAVKILPRPDDTGGETASGKLPWLAVLALLIALAAWFAGYLAWQNLSTRVATFATGQIDLDQRLVAALAASDSRTAALEAQFAEQASAIAAQTTALERQRELAEQTYQALREEVGQDRNRWVIAEIEYLMRVAAHRLMLARDVDAAIAALETADRRLHDLGDPAWLGVREQVSDEVAALRAVPEVDIEGLALSLRSLAKRARTLPVLGARYRPGDARGAGDKDAEAAARGEDWREALEVAWQEVKGLVEVRRNDEPVKAMLAPELEYFLYQNLRLQLDAARLALLRGEAPLYAESLRSARDWASTYFDQENASTQATVAELDRLLAVDIAPPLPEVGGALRAMREVPAYREARGGGS
jgi:uroporphyrin-3 C-methyltransferase